ncbi:hypothetical protein NHL50_04115 [Acidimicrobiia bacterium EGI L10123]|uniref:hypothetical protein n=1 Tax=Salinilacustrithrix flava TaxID=2957203 RepID=UPI003D7C2945|nr:hypothetical protein [Acidimicrobiia bacterium EGI L10123]
MRTRLAAAVVAICLLTGLLAAAPAWSETASSPLAPAAGSEPIALGFNQDWGTQAPLDLLLDDVALRQLAELGAGTIRLPVGCWHVGACAYGDRYDDDRDFGAVGSWDFTALDAAIDHLHDNGFEVIVAPHPGDRMFRPGWIVVDRHYRSTAAYLEAIVSHLDVRYGPMAYSFFETELDTSERTEADGTVSYRYAADGDEIRSRWQGWLRDRYATLPALRAAHAAKYRGWADVPLPVLGSSAGVPQGIYGTAAAADLRAFLGDDAAARYNALGALVHERSPGSEWWGPTVNLQSLHTERGTHLASDLTAVGPTLSDLASQPEIDVLSVDGYRSWSISEAWRAAADWKVAAKVAAEHGKQVAIVELGAPTSARLVNAFLGADAGAENLRAVLLWQARDRPNAAEAGFGYFDVHGIARAERAGFVRWVFDRLGAPGRAVYTPGTTPMAYREHLLQPVLAQDLRIVQDIEAIATAMASGMDVEPIVGPDR